MRLLISPFVIFGAFATGPIDSELHTMSGIAVNLTDPARPIAAKVEFQIDNGLCTVQVYAPLFGSGPCHVKLIDKVTRQLEITSDGSPAIIWNGTTKGNFFSGHYLIKGSQQNGSFYLARLVHRAPILPTVKSERAPLRSSCYPTIEASIKGEFHGWDGETIFKLDNGQIWQQAEYDYNYDYDYSPDVTIYSTSEGCKMKVEGEEETVLVKRIK